METLQGGSAFSPASVISKEKARLQAAVLARDLGCPSANSEEIVSCLRQLPAEALSDGQTRLLAVSGPFQYWSPVADEIYLQEPLAEALQRSRPLKVDMLIGSAQQDGLISRAKAIKRFEESQGRANSKLAFYQALQNSLGGEDSNPDVLDAATWFYSLQHSSTEYASFSRALENATRDRFIICPTIDMAKYWAGHDRGQVFMYHVPESSSLSRHDLPPSGNRKMQELVGILQLCLIIPAKWKDNATGQLWALASVDICSQEAKAAISSSSLELLPDIQYAFGLPFFPQYGNQYTQEEKTLSLQIMQYLANFIRSGNPNSPYTFSRRASGTTSPWPMFRADSEGDNYKEFTTSLHNRKGLRKAECSFWSDYIQTLETSTGRGEQQFTKRRPGNELAATSVTKTTQEKAFEDKVAYSK